MFDIDGVICDVSERYARSLEEAGGRSLRELHSKKRRKFWRVFLSEKYMHLDKPNPRGIELVRLRKRQGYFIVLLSGRRYDTQYKFTLRQLRQWGVPFDRIFLRPSGLLVKDYVFKGRVLRRLILSGYEVVEFHDDSLEIIEYVRVNFPNMRVILWENLQPIV